MKKFAGLWPALLIAAVAATAAGQDVTAPATAPGATASPAAEAPAPLSPEARDILQMLQDRKNTLKDFVAKVDYTVLDLAGDLDGYIGTIDYLDTPAGPEFSVDFTTDTFNGKPTHPHKRQVIYDTHTVTAIDYQAKQFQQSAVSTSAGSLESEVPIPIGIRVDDVTANFAVTVLPRDPKNPPDMVTLRLVPLVKGKFNYQQLDVTVDKKLQIPVKIVVYSTKDDITTIKFIEPEINTGKAKMLSAAVPTGADWTIHKPAPTAPATAPAPAR